MVQTTFQTHPPTWRRPQTTTHLFPLRHESAEAAKAFLCQEQAWQLEALPQLHFLRMFVLEARENLDGRILPARLVLSVVCDGAPADFFRDWVQLANEPLCALFQFCEGFDEAHLTAWLMAHTCRPSTYHIGAVHTTAEQIREEHRLAAAIQTWLDERSGEKDWDGMDVLQIRREIQGFVRANGDLPQAPRPPIPFAWRCRQWASAALSAGTLLIIPALLALSIPAGRSSLWAFALTTIAMAAALIAIWALLVRAHEILEPDHVILAKPGQTAALLEDEDHIVQNQFGMASMVRNSLFRRTNIRFTLWLSNQLSRHYWHKGKLVGIDTIHFARIHLLDRGRQMLFLSDFDGGWDRYLFDFLGVGALAVVPTWSSLDGCPKARWLRFPTRGFSQRFLPFTRACQVRTQLWYSSRPYLSLRDIDRNAQIRAGLHGDMNMGQTRQWLALF